MIEGLDETSVAFMTDDPQTNINDFAKDVRRLIGGAIVDNEQFEIIERLAQHAVDRLAERCSRVVSWKQHRDSRLHQTPTSDRGRVYFDSAASPVGFKPNKAASCQVSPR